MTKKCGYIALIGRPNAGKSTLLNALVGDKVAVVSRKPQTTRNRILGVAMEQDAQILVLDTPGIHQDRGLGLLNETMNRVALQVAKEGDAIVYLIDPRPGFTAEDQRYLDKVLNATVAPFLIVLTKVDAQKTAEIDVARKKVTAALAEFFADERRAAWKERWLTGKVLDVSAKRPDEVKKLKAYLATALPESPWLFPEDDLTDMPRVFIAGELIREQIFRQLNQEVPYATAVKVDEVSFKPDLVVVRATILVERKSQKPILLGKGGAQIKAIGMYARASLEKHFDKKVFLDLQVSVAEGWTSDQRLIAELANLQSDLGANSGET